MSAQPIPFPAQAKVIRISATSAAPTAVQLPVAANQARIVNHGSDAYLAFADTQAAAVATVPAAGAGTATSCPSLGGSDITMTIPNDTAKWVSAILDVAAAGTTFIDIAIGEGL